MCATIFRLIAPSSVTLLMATQPKKQDKNIFLFVGHVFKTTSKNIALYNKTAKHPYKIACLSDKDDYLPLPKWILRIKTDFSNPESIEKSLQPYRDRLIGVSASSESRIPLFQKIIPFLPKELLLPSVESLTNSTNKIHMRKRLLAHNTQISPRFIVINNSSTKTLSKVEKQIGFPAIVKPAGLASSLLITVSYDKEELQKNLINIFKKINSIYTEKSGRGTPQVLAEEMMEGQMYSTDAYINNKGIATCLPLITSCNGRSIGFKDFFEYITSIPVTLPKKETLAAFKTAQEAVTAVGLTNSTAHIEMILTQNGWKIVELGPRIGGFREVLYSLSYGINHTINEILVRTGHKPILKKKILTHSALMQFYPEKEGKITHLHGIQKVKNLKSFHKIIILGHHGQKSLFALNGGKAVIRIYLSHKSQQQIREDIRRAETSIKIETK